VIGRFSYSGTEEQYHPRSYRCNLGCSTGWTRPIPLRASVTSTEVSKLRANDFRNRPNSSRLRRPERHLILIFPLAPCPAEPAGPAIPAGPVSTGEIPRVRAHIHGVTKKVRQGSALRCICLCSNGLKCRTCDRNEVRHRFGNCAKVRHRFDNTHSINIAFSIRQPEERGLAPIRE